MKIFNNLAFLLLLLVAHSAKASLIEYQLTSLGGSTYQYDYTVSNDGSLGPGSNIEWFAIMFDPAFYDESSLTIVTPDPPASDWDEIILLSGLLVPAAYDAFSLSTGIADGISVTGFAVKFDWLGAGDPGSQSFEIYDPDNSEILYSGTTLLQNGVAAVPSPNTISLLLSGVLLLWSTRIKKRFSN